MATLAANNLTIADIVKMTNPDGTPAKMAELLNQQNAAVKDSIWQKCNKLDAHQYGVETSLGTASLRGPYEGVTPSASSSAQATETTTVIADWARIDKLVAELGGNLGAILEGEVRRKTENIGQKYAQLVFYGNHSTTPREFNGFAQRYSATANNNGENIVKAGGSGSDNSSIWLICWGMDKIYGIYADGQPAGLFHKDWGLRPVVDATGPAGATFTAYEQELSWSCGLAVQDWRFASRICNIDISALVAGSGADLPDKMIEAYHCIPSFEGVSPAWYMNRTTFKELHKQCRNDVTSGGQLSYDVVDGKPMAEFLKIPVRLVDRLTETEATVT